jgi:acyl-coenzyme A synthetase/AMP-(fatty) acid ligase
LRTLTQAGGALGTQTRWAAYRFMQETGGRFHVLYGQTEAAPRMTTLHHDDFPFAPESVGTPLPGCRIEIDDPTPAD